MNKNLTMVTRLNKSIEKFLKKIGITDFYKSKKKSLYTLFHKKRKSLFNLWKKLKKSVTYQVKLNWFKIQNFYGFVVVKYIWTFTTFTFVYFILLGLLSIWLGNFINLHLLKSAIAPYFVGIAVMFGGILAIISSINLSLIQNSGENFSFGFYKDNAKDIVQDMIYVFIIISIILLFFASLFTKDYATVFIGINLSFGNLSLHASIFLIGLVLYLIFYLNRRVFMRMQPKSAIDQVRNNSISLLRKTRKRVKTASQIVANNPKSKDSVQPEEYEPYFYQGSPPLNYLSERISYLFDFHDKLVSKNERSLAIFVIDTITEIVKAYFQIRSDSSLVLPTEYILATTSDSQAFLTPILERMVSVGISYARTYDNNGVSKVVHTLKYLSLMASEIKYVAGRHRDSPIQEQCRGYLDQLVTSIIDLKNDEGVFQASDAYGVLAQNDINKGYYLELITIYSMLDKLTIYSVGKRFESGLHAIFDSYTKIINALIVSRWNAEHQLSLMFEHLEQAVLLSYALTFRNTLQDRHFTQTEIAKPYEHLRDLIIRIPYEVEHSSGDKEREWISTFVDSVDTLRLSLRKISDTINNADHMLIWSFGQIIKDIGVLLLNLTQKPKWNSRSRELSGYARDYLHQAKWFSNGATSIESNNNYDQLVEAVAQIGLKSLEVDEIDIATDSVNVLYSFAVEMLQKQASGSGRTEPEIMLYACFVGILSLKLGKIVVVDKTKQNIQEFQLQYETKWFANMPPEFESHFTRNQLKADVEELIQNRQDRARIYDMERGSASILFEKVTNEDIQAFIEYIWP